uniref:Uncharacterized protein n=1 Tax=Romanomermis culicivorax TaxID=13658 RepID=A0A915IH85_ROMCU
MTSIVNSFWHLTRRCDTVETDETEETSRRAFSDAHNAIRHKAADAAIAVLPTYTRNVGHQVDGYVPILRVIFEQSSDDYTFIKCEQNSQAILCELLKIQQKNPD